MEITMVNEVITKRLETLRANMKRDSVDVCLIPSEDCHLSEYVADAFKLRAYFSGFTGSAGKLIVTADSGYLFADGRYFLQAERQIEGTGLTLVRIGVVGEPTVTELCAKLLANGGVLFADGTRLSAAYAEELEKALKAKGARLKLTGTTVSDSAEMPPQEFSHVRALPASITGRSCAEKLSDVRKVMTENDSNIYMTASLEENAWLYNLRGSDIEDTPVFYSYSIITEHEAYLFADPCAVSAVKKELAEAGVTLMPYSPQVLEETIASFSDSRFIIDKSMLNASMVAAIPKSAKIVEKSGIITALKAVKNPIEIENTGRVHLLDGVAVARFMRFIKTADTRALDEYTAGEKLEDYRKLCSDYHGPSFGTICAYGANAAMMHYSAPASGSARLDPGAMLLVDSGGQYEGGTTDITRMFALGNISDEIKKSYTAVCVSMLRLQSAVFLKGTKCASLDMLARQPIWQLGIDYRCGTGHGIGYMLCVHEGPNRIHYSNVKGEIEPGMITSDEPGIYIDGKYGIRIENEILCTEAFENEYGSFRRFEPVTVCPIDLDAIDPSLMDESDRAALNAYHRFVYKSLAPLMDESERVWLAEYTREI